MAGSAHCLAAYALWKIGLGTVGSGPRGAAAGSSPAESETGSAALAYLGLLLVSLRVLFGHSSDQGQQDRTTTGGVLGWPEGRLLVAIAGGCVIAAAICQTYAAVRGTFAQDNKLLEKTPGERELFLRIGRIGLDARYQRL